MLPTLNPIYVPQRNREVLTKRPSPAPYKKVFRIVHNFPVYETDARGIVRR